MRTKMTALITVLLLVAFLLTILIGLTYLIGSTAGIPLRLGLPSALRWFGLFFLAAGFTILIWVCRYRSPIDIVVSTYVTIVNAVYGVRPVEQVQRTEPLIIAGPHRYVRHPLYSAAILLMLGWWLVLEYSCLLIATVFLGLWFNFVVAPFEEQELKLLFGDEYTSYASGTPRFFPSVRRRGNLEAKR